MNSLIKKEYFDLINKLNKSNKHRNQNTEVYFYIDETDSETAKLFVAISNEQKILLAEKNYLGTWKAKELSGFFNLEEYLVTFLDRRKSEIDLTYFIKSHIFKF